MAFERKPKLSVNFILWKALQLFICFYLLSLSQLQILETLYVFSFCKNLFLIQIIMYFRQWGAQKFAFRSIAKAYVCFRNEHYIIVTNIIVVWNMMILIPGFALCARYEMNDFVANLFTKCDLLLCSLPSGQVGPLTQYCLACFWPKQVKPGFTNYQPPGLADQIKFEVKSQRLRNFDNNPQKNHFLKDWKNQGTPTLFKIFLKLLKNIIIYKAKYWRKLG